MKVVQILSRTLPNVLNNDSALPSHCFESLSACQKDVEHPLLSAGFLSLRGWHRNRFRCLCVCVCVCRGSTQKNPLRLRNKKSACSSSSRRRQRRRRRQQQLDRKTVSHPHCAALFTGSCERKKIINPLPPPSSVLLRRNFHDGLGWKNAWLFFNQVE